VDFLYIAAAVTLAARGVPGRLVWNASVVLPGSQFRIRSCSTFAGQLSGSEVISYPGAKDRLNNNKLRADAAGPRSFC